VTTTTAPARDALDRATLVIAGVVILGAVMSILDDGAQVPRATSALNARQPLGGSIGTALLAGAER
jgi:hypothetical protein